MKPDRTNYEIWFIDYLDGNLDEHAVAGLFKFLEENPDLKEEFGELSGYSLVPPDIVFNQKDMLKKSFQDLSDEQFDYLCIARAENDLGAGQEEELNEIITSDPSKADRYSLISRLKLKPPDVEYKYKYRLRKLTVARKIIRYSIIGLSAAASVLVLFTVIRNNPVAVPDLQVTEVVNDTSRSLVNPPMETKTAQLEENTAVVTGQEDKNSSANEILAASEYSIIANTISPEPEITETVADTGNIRASERVDVGKVRFRPYEGLYAGIPEASLIAINTNDYNLPDFDEVPGINDRFAKFFREKILHSAHPTYGELKAYEIADAGINGLNRLLGWNMSLEENIDENGDIASIHFSSRLVKFNAPVKNNEEAQ